MTKLKAIAAAAVLMMPVSAAAENVVAKTGDSVANFFRDEGASVELTTDGAGDPLLKTEYYGNSFTIIFYGCNSNTDCNSIQFYSGYVSKGSVRLAKTNQWNTDNRFARSYIDEDGDARIEMDVFLGDEGMNPDDFAQVVGLWTRRMTEFEEFIGW
ncbi:YbjN domain-containing protein [Leisingera sp. M523]|uniref:YbjN domain-containing protein n=1 Tax=Leisingera sp. M523 TaxID=2867013 RepID=UPI0021A81435|nr:YbjN domain-containing protein [Leisingera sp. M523]UWQ28470.1 YbjN domain-containing protein [Leisingera sp. M523]